MDSPEAYNHLRKDKKFAAILDQTDAKSNVQCIDVYPDLLRTIVYQQLATKAADNIYLRFLGIFGGISPEPEELLETDDEILRSAGLSRSKSQYLKNIAVYFQENPIIYWEALSDDEIRHALLSIKGVGAWTVNIILMFTLAREDVFPIGDLAIRRAMIDIYKLDDSIPKKAHYQELQSIASSWQPHRTLASLHLWSYYSSVMKR